MNLAESNSENRSTLEERMTAIRNDLAKPSAEQVRKTVAEIKAAQAEVLDSDVNQEFPAKRDLQSYKRRGRHTLRLSDL